MITAGDIALLLAAKRALSKLSMTAWDSTHERRIKNLIRELTDLIERCERDAAHTMNVKGTP